METAPDHSPRTGAALRRVPTQARSRDKVERALAAAESLLQDSGVDAITLVSVAERAGVSVGALYQYLPDREAIVAALSERYHTRHEALMDEIMDRLIETVDSTTVDEAVAELFGAIAGLYRSERGTRALRSRLQGTEQLAATRAHKERMVAKVARLLGAFGLGAPLDTTTGSASPRDVERIARTLFFAADAVLHEAFAVDDGGDASLLAELDRLTIAYLALPRSGPQRD